MSLEYLENNEQRLRNVFGLIKSLNQKIRSLEQAVMLVDQAVRSIEFNATDKTTPSDSVKAEWPINQAMVKNSQPKPKRGFFLKARELAEVLGVSESRLYALKKLGLPSINFSKRNVRYDCDAAVAWFRSYAKNNENQNYENA